jgi:hypothetical protein
MKLTRALAETLKQQPGEEGVARGVAPKEGAAIMCSAIIAIKTCTKQLLQIIIERIEHFENKEGLLFECPLLLHLSRGIIIACNQQGHVE